MMLEREGGTRPLDEQGWYGKKAGQDWHASYVEVLPSLQLFKMHY